MWQDTQTWLLAHRVQPSGLVAYRNDTEDIVLRYPATWEIKEGALGTIVSFLSPLTTQNRIRENINLMEQDLPSDQFSLATYTDGTVQTLHMVNPNIRFVASDAMTIAGFAAHGVTYEEETSLGPVTFRQVWFIKGAKAYLFTLLATPETFDANNAVLEKMLGTMNIGA